MTEEERADIADELCEAIWNNNDSSALALIRELKEKWPGESGEDLFRYSDGENALSHAAYNGNVKILRAILESGCDINVRDVSHIHLL